MFINYLITILNVYKHLNLKSNPSKKANGIIVESKVLQGKGSAATVLIKEGSLKIGDFFVAGPSYGKIRAMHDDMGKKIVEAKLSTNPFINLSFFTRF